MQQPTQPAFLPGTLLGRYRVEGLLGTGGMGSVYRTTRVDDGAVFAVKALHPHIAKKAEHQKRFLREARAATATKHPNVVKIEEVFEHDGAPLFAMELLRGESLERVILRDKRIPLDRFSRIMICVTSAVGTAHAAGIVHRDLKPDNIFIGDDGTVKVLDFGIAKLTASQGLAAETEALTRTGMLMGTPFYMSPEQAFGEKKIDHRSDIWSLGIISYYALSGVLPTHGTVFADVFRLVVSGRFATLNRLVPGLPAEVVALVDRMLKLDPAARPWDLRDVYGALQRYTNVAAPAFGMAVAPLFDELSSEYDEAERISLAHAPTSAPGPGSLPFALAPSPLRSMNAATDPLRGPSTPGARTPVANTLGDTEAGTIALNSATPLSAAARMMASTPSGAPPTGAVTPAEARAVPWVAIVAAIVLVAALATAAVLLR